MGPPNNPDDSTATQSKVQPTASTLLTSTPSGRAPGPSTDRLTSTVASGRVMTWLNLLHAAHCSMRSWIATAP